MNIIFNEFEKYYFDLVYGSLEINKFENWIYSNKDLKNILNEDDYLDLISLNFKSKHIKYEIEKILTKYIDYSKFEKKRVLSLLYRAFEQKKIYLISFASFMICIAMGITFSKISD